jgi:hypothetical protein
VSDDTTLDGSIVPFGKYRGQSVDAVLSDLEYCAWLKAQPWLEQRFPAFSAVLVTNGASLVLSNPGAHDGQASPEHNEMQARFLDPGWRLALARVLTGDFGFSTAVTGLQHWLGCDKVNQYTRKLACHTCGIDSRKPCPGRHGSISTTSPRTTEPAFEDSGWDVTFRCLPWELDWYCECTDRTACPHCTSHCAHCAHYQQGRSGCADCQHAATVWRHCQAWHGGDRYEQPSEGFSSANVRLGVELKPDLGDDYPVVLRQVQRYVSNDRRRAQYQGALVPDTHVVISRRAQFRSVTWEQVQAVFRNSGVQLLREDMLSA